jgi:processive 1,2-diacylglycerol beta-glucosyltransferase
MVCTDFGCHSFWVNPAVNYYFGATDTVKQCLKGFGVTEEKIVVTGIPIQSKFAKVQNKAELLKKFELQPDIFTMLIVGGQVTLRELQDILEGIDRKNQGKIQYLVVAGRDKYLKQSLEKSDLDKNSHVKVFGFVDNMEELMSVSDLIFSKAGGLTVSECLAEGLPLVINKVIPGQEEDNVNYLVEKGAAVKVGDYKEIVGVVNNLIDNPDKVSAMKIAAKKIGKPNSAETMADYVVDKIK